MRKNNISPIVVLASLIILVPLLRCTLFFDSYLIKLWVMQFGVGVLLIYFCYQLLFGDIKFQINAAIGLALIYLGINFISWLLIPAPHKFPALLTLSALFFYILLCILVSQYLRDLKAQNLIVTLWIIVTIGVSIYGVWQYIQKTRVIATLGNENFLGSHLGISIPVGLGYFARYKKNRRILIPGLVVLLLFFTTLYLTHSRGAWLGTIGGLCSFAIIGWGPKGKRAIIAVVMIVCITALTLAPWAIRFIATQFQGDVRPPIWESSIYMISEKPILGWGKGAYFIFYPKFRIQDYWLTKSPTDLTTHAHNEFLQIWAETGLIGLIIFLIFIFTVLRIGVRRVDEIKGPHRFILLGLISGIIGLFLHNLVCNNLQMPSSAIFLWFTLGMVIAHSPIPAKSGVVVRGPSRYGILLAITLFVVIIIWQICVRTIIAQYLFKEGWHHREKEEWSLAIKKYERAIQWYPWDVEMYYRTAYAYTMNGQYDKAIERYNDVIRLAPLYGSVHRNMGIIYMKKGECRLAVESFLQALWINEYDIITRANLSRINPARKSKAFQ